LVITTASGSYWYYAQTFRNGWDSSAYPARGDLPLGSVSYTVGDFNGDMKDDLLITTPSGSHWYYSTGYGTWDTTAVTPRPDLPLGSVRYVVDDDDGDAAHKKDLIITTASGTYWYDSTGLGWNQVRVGTGAL
jgi:hypothetical protein